MPTRLDAAPWRRIHTRIAIALGLGWMLDTFEVQIIGSVIPGHPGRARPRRRAGGVDQHRLIHRDRAGRPGLRLPRQPARPQTAFRRHPHPVFGGRGRGRAQPQLLDLHGVPVPHRTRRGGEYSAVTSAIAEFMPARNRPAATASSPGAPGRTGVGSRSPTGAAGSRRRTWRACSTSRSVARPHGPCQRRARWRTRAGDCPRPRRGAPRRDRRRQRGCRLPVHRPSACGHRLTPHSGRPFAFRKEPTGCPARWRRRWIGGGEGSPRWRWHRGPNHWTGRDWPAR
jgi:hypothetical protein